jgi:predicted O-methyltransferase YrrM
MGRKVLTRVSERRLADRTAARAWAQSQASSPEETLRPIDSALWSEAVAFEDSLRRKASTVLAEAPDLGGGGAYPVLYFLARLMRPTSVVETGVAAGFSSQAILSALEENEHGTLYSSEFPYFRLADPHRYVGILVEERHRKSWQLHLDGDRKNLPRILRDCGSVDLFHYDSDKSYLGRRFALQVVGSRLSPKAVVVMDDIQDNLFFRDYLHETSAVARVFEFESKFVGILGLEHWM